MKYISVKEAAEKWNIGIRRVQFFCAGGKIPDAKHCGHKWLIPENAVRPDDARTKFGRAETLSRNFPILIFSSLYANRENLSEENLEILKAQELYLTGDFSAAIDAARKLLANTKSTSSRFIANIIIAYHSIPLGLVGEYASACAAAESIVKNEAPENEEYKLILAGLKYHISWNEADFLGTDLSKLGPDAFVYYRTLVFMSSTVSSINVHPNAAFICASMAYEAESRGILPLAMQLYIYAAVCCSKIGDTEKSEDFVKRACDISVTNNWSAYLSKYYYVIQSQTDKYLKKENPEFLAAVRVAASKNVGNWKFVANSFHSSTIFDKRISASEYEFLHLIMYGLTNKEISTVLGISVTDVSNRICRLCANLKLSGKKDLAEFARLTFKKQ